jgi:hypothetical protein
LVLKHLKGKLVWWSFENHQTADEGGWYAIIKDQHFDIDQYPSSNTRNQVRKALKNCTVKRIEATWLAENGLEVLEKAMHKMSAKPSKKTINAFRKKYQVAIAFDDIIHCYGIFNNDQLIGFCEIYYYEGIEANISQIRLNPAFNGVYPMYALIHMLSEEYLKSNKVQYLSDGYRNLLHETEVQEFLVRKFGFKKAGLILKLQFRFPFGLFFSNSLFFVKRLSIIKSINALVKIIEIEKSQNKKG